MVDVQLLYSINVLLLHVTCMCKMMHYYSTSIDIPTKCFKGIIKYIKVVKSSYIVDVWCCTVPDMGSVMFIIMGVLTVIV